MKTESVVLCLGLLLALPAHCDEKDKDAFDFSALMPLGAMYHQAQGWFTDAIFEAIEKNSLEKKDLPDPPFDEIALERASCAGFGICPSDSMRFLRSGVVYYWGDANVERLGCFKTNAPEYLALEFEGLAEILGRVEIWDMDDWYVATVASHGFSVYYSVVREGDRKVIWSYDDAAPVALVLFGEYLIQTLDSFEWEKVKRVDSAAECLRWIPELHRGDNDNKRQ